jgi:hypothetical protein
VGLVVRAADLADSVDAKAPVPAGALGRVFAKDFLDCGFELREGREGAYLLVLALT